MSFSDRVTRRKSERYCPVVRWQRKNVCRAKAKSAKGKCKMAVVAFVERLNETKTRISEGGRDIGMPYARSASDVDRSAHEVKAVGDPADETVMFPCPSGARDGSPM
jgi:hypothetical protein